MNPLIHAIIFNRDMTQTKSNCIYMTNWDTIARPKKEGGLGIRNFGRNVCWREPYG